MFGLFNAIDSLCHPLPAAVRLLLYGLVMGLVGMFIYWKTSPQKRLISLKQEIAHAQKAMRAYKGTDGKEVLRLSLATVSPALKQVLFVTGPTALAMIPVILMVAWLEEAYSYRMPTAGESIALHTDAPIRLTPSADFESTDDRHGTFRWPRVEAPLSVVQASDGRELLKLPIARPIADIGKPRWWSRILEGGTRIELPADATVSSIKFVFPPLELVGFGPGWMRSWYMPFMFALSIAALIMKFSVKIV